mmetsp:Transcript_1336/g.4239  ORF Transcript_1336/g.4239 Transcript_1336/m.4239 type:complete len:298 (-) Transcript_1336:93-986(-)
MQPLCGRVGLLGRRVEIRRRVGASVVPLVQRPLADGVEALGRAVEPVLDAVRVVEDLVALLEPVLCPRIRIRLDLHALDRVSDPQAGGRDRVAPHLEHPILDPVRRLGAPSQNVRAVEPQRGHLAKQLLLDDERRRPDGLQALKVALRPAVLDHRIVPRRCMHVPESVRRRQRRRVGGGVSREVGHRLCEDVVRLGHEDVLLLDAVCEAAPEELDHRVGPIQDPKVAVLGQHLGREGWHEHGRDIRRRRIGQPSLGRADAREASHLGALSVRRPLLPPVIVHDPALPAVVGGPLAGQ